jgi:hypothetical protein
LKSWVEQYKGNHFTILNHILKVSQGRVFCQKTSTLGGKFYKHAYSPCIVSIEV